MGFSLKSNIDLSKEPVFLEGIYKMPKDWMVKMLIKIILNKKQKKNLPYNNNNNNLPLVKYEDEYRYFSKYIL